MTRLKFMDLFNQQIKSLWPKWEPDQPLVDLYAEEFSKYQSEDVLKAFRRHKVEQDYQEPRIPMVIKHLRAVIGERKAEERKQQAGTEWPGQVFIVIHTNPSGQVDFFRDFHIPTARAQLPRPFDSQRMDKHLSEVKETYGRQHPFGVWSGEIHTEDTAQKRIVDIRAGWTKVWVNKQYAKPVSGKVLEGVCKVSEVLTDIPAMVQHEVLTDDAIPF